MTAPQKSKALSSYDLVLDILAQAEKPMTAAEIAEAAGLDDVSCRGALVEIRQEGLATCFCGRWALLEPGQSQPGPKAKPEPELPEYAAWSNGAPDRTVRLPHVLAACFDVCPPPGKPFPNVDAWVEMIVAAAGFVWPDPPQGEGDDDR